MTLMSIDDLREKYLRFFENKGHQRVPSAPLVPDNDPTTLFTGSGMQPMVPYLLGQPHPAGQRLTDSQKCFRADDISEIGDNRHTTFFEMLGNWSLGDYFKQEQLPWIFTFLTDELGLDPQRIYVTVFIGDEAHNIPRDTESAKIWKELFAQKGIEAKDVDMGSVENAATIGMHGERIFYYGAKNWWSRVGVPQNMSTGEPGGPDSEMFYEFPNIEHNPKFGEQCHPNCDCGRFLEIGNNVFMEYVKKADGSFGLLPNKNVDFGGGLERIAVAVNDNPDVIAVCHGMVIQHLEKLSGKRYGEGTNETIAFRIIADHIKAATFLIGDGVNPSNTDQGYFVRRLLRRAVRYSDTLGIRIAGLSTLVDPILEFYKNAYPDTYAKADVIKQEVNTEEEKFRRTLQHGLKEFETVATNSRNGQITGTDAFILFSTYGFPLEMSQELAAERGLQINKDEFEKALSAHQELSRKGAEKRFKGGLADHSDQSVKYHTATHLLHQALRQVLGDHVFQKGSNITADRLRFDFSHPTKVTPEELANVERLINEKISENLDVTREEMTVQEAQQKNALGLFEHKYGDTVSVYSIGTFSREICGGPHVTQTGTLGIFHVVKEESAGAGVRRIKAILKEPPK